MQSCPRCDTALKEVDGEPACLKCGIRMSDVCDSDAGDADACDSDAGDDAASTWDKPVLVVDRNPPSDHDEWLKNMVNEQIRKLFIGDY